MTSSTACASTTRFLPSRSTGKERDAESGNDYFEARYYSSSMGRFMSPDWSAKEEPVPYANLNEPQSLNLYAYAGNNPLTRADADGHFWEEMKNLWNWGHYVNNAGLNAALRKLPKGAIRMLFGQTRLRLTTFQMQSTTVNRWLAVFWSLDL